MVILITVYVDGKRLYRGCTYGYGNHFKDTAIRLVIDEGYGEEFNNDYYKFCGSTNVLFDVVDVPRKKDLLEPLT